jgi:hypothetical protein
MDLNLRINIDLAKSTNYIPMGFWVKPVAGDPKKPFYRITDLGIPMVKVEDGSALGYSVYVLNVDVSDDVVPSASNPQWRLIESAELIYIQQAFIERLWTQMLIAEGAEIGGFEIGNGFLQSKAKDALNINAILLNGLDGSGHLARRKIRWNSYGDITIEGSVISPFVDLKDNPSLLGGAENTPVNMFRFARTTETGMGYYYTLKCIKELGGMILRFHNISNRGSAIEINSEVANGFYEDGTSFTTLTLAVGYAVEMICVADSVGFHSWDIIKRYRCRPYTV